MIAQTEELSASPYALDEEDKGSKDETIDENNADHEMSLNDLLRGSGLGKTQLFLWTLVFLVATMQVSIYLKTAILMPYLHCEWDLNSGLEAVIGSSCPVFSTFGGVVAGNLADKFGRKIVLLVTTVFLAFGSIAIAASPNVWVLLAGRILQGICIGMGYPVAYIYAAEITDSKNNELAILSVGVGAQFGGVFIALVSYLALNDIGWRYLVAVVSTPLPFLIIGLILAPETPRFLLVQGKGEEALQLLKKMYKWNGVPFPESCLSIKAASLEKAGKFSRIFHREFRKLTILLTIIYFANLYIYLAFAAYLPLASADTEELPNIPTLNETSCGDVLDRKDILQSFIAFLGDVVGCVMSVFLGKRFGKKLIVASFAVLALVTTVSAIFDLNEIFKVLDSMLLRLCVTGSRILLWSISVEGYPAAVRSTASSFIHGVGETGGTVGSFLTYLLFPISSVSVVSMFVGIAGVQLLATVLLNTGNKDKDIVLANPASNLAVTASM